LNIRELDIGNVGARFECGPQAARPRSLINGGEREQIQSVLNEIKEDDIFFDVGANIGVYTCFAGAKCRETKVVAFEPYPPNVEQLKANVRHSKLSNVQIEAIGLSDKKDTIDFSEPKNEVGLRTGSIKQSTGGSRYQVKIRGGDDLIQNEDIPEPNVLKIDVEGAEGVVVQGLKNTLQNGVCRTIFCEIHPEGHHPDAPSIEDFGMTPDEFISWLENIGFEKCYLRERGRQLHLKMEYAEDV
jgi:FkbM family methyltransferase